MSHENNGDTDCNWRARYNHQRIIKETRGLGGWRTSGDYPNNKIVGITRNTEKSSGDFKRLAVA